LKRQFKDRYVEEVIETNNGRRRGLERKAMRSRSNSANDQAAGHKGSALGHVIDAAKDATYVTIVQQQIHPNNYWTRDP
jgi:hypothetical protein